MPSVAVAGSDGLSRCSAVVDGEVEGDSTVAALRVDRCYRVDRGGSIDRIVPSVAVACGINEYDVVTIMDGEIQQQDTVTVCYLW